MTGSSTLRRYAFAAKSGSWAWRAALWIVAACVWSAVALCASSASAQEKRPEKWAQPVLLVHSENFYRVTRDFYRSAQPSAEAFRAYEGFGIRTVLNMREWHDDDDEARGTKLVLVHIPIRTNKVGNDETVIKVLQAIRDAEKPVLLHCMHGADRTGLITAMYRMVEQGWSREEALDELRNGGFGFHSVWRSIPEYLKTVDAEKIRKALH